MIKILQMCFTAWSQVIQIILQAKAKAWVFADHFCSHFNARSFSTHSKTWFDFEVITVYCHFFCFLSPKSCFKFNCDPLSKLKLTWKRSDPHVFTAVVGRRTTSPDRKGLRTWQGMFWNVLQWGKSIKNP